MSNLSGERRRKMLGFLAKLKEKNLDDSEIQAINEIELALTEKRYGLVWEQHSERVDEELKTKIPVFAQDDERTVLLDHGYECNFLIEGDNLHRLYLLEKTNKGMIDVIYIDPPYNTGNKDFIYNDDYIEKNDSYSHSKWLSFMANRLKLCKKLLTKDGIVVISIGYQEVHNLYLLCKEIFNDKTITEITVQTSGGKPKDGFTYLHEYLIFITGESFTPRAMSFVGGNSRSPYEGLTLSTFSKINRPNQAYPIYINKETGSIEGIGKSLTERIREGSYTGEKANFQFNYNEAPNGCVAVWPVSKKGIDCVWRLIPNRLMSDWEKGYIKVTRNKSKSSNNLFSIQYLPEGVIKKIESGELPIKGREPNKPTLILGDNQTQGGEIPTILTETSFHTTNGTKLIRDIFGSEVFKYPKSLELIMELMRSITKPNSIVLDFFAGTGTTGQAVLELNKDDGGNRRFILCTNNENGICTEVAFPRLKTIITGKRNNDTYYNEAIPSNLLYYTTTFIERFPTENSLNIELLDHTPEMIQLQNMTVLNNSCMAILDEDDIDIAIKNANQKAKIYIADDVFLSSMQRAALLEKECTLEKIPECYFNFELKEVGE